MRADSLNFIAIQAFRRSDLAEQVVTLPAPCKQDALDYEIAATPCEVRLIRHVFGHKVRVLVTSLLNLDAYPAGDFGALYHSRWRIEEAFTRIKHRLALEQLSGLSWLAAQQDFGARILCDNLNALAVHAASEFLDPNINSTLSDSYSLLRDLRLSCGRMPYVVIVQSIHGVVNDNVNSNTSIAYLRWSLRH
jgi:hypothetical protein